MQKDETYTEVGFTYKYLFHKSRVIGSINLDDFILLSHTYKHTQRRDYVLWATQTKDKLTR